MVAFFLHIYDFLQSRRRLCLGLLAAITAMLLVMLTSMRYNENIYDFLPVSGNKQKAITIYQDITGGQRIIAMFRKIDGDSTDIERLTEAVDTFALKIEANSVHGPTLETTTQVDFDKMTGITDFVYQNIPLMLTDSDYVRMERLLTQNDFVERQLADDVQMIMMPASGLLTLNISNDPLGLFTPVMERLQTRQSAQAMEIDDGYIFTSGKQYAVAMLTSPYGATESANNHQLVEYVDSVAKQTMLAVPDVKVAITGSPVIAVGNATQIKKDSLLAIAISVTLILLLLLFSFRKVRNLLLIGAAIVFGWLFAMGLIAVMRSDVSLIVLGIGSIIIGIAVNYPLHFIAHTDHNGTVREVLKEMVTPLLIGNITTVGAFASLMPLSAPALRDLGFFAAFMLIGTILFVLIFLPHLVKERIAGGKKSLSFEKLSSISPDHHRWLLPLIILLTLVFGYLSLGTSFDTDMHHINYMTDEQTELIEKMQTSSGINDSADVYIVAEGATWNEALEARRSLAPMLDSLKQCGLLKSYSDVTDFICSAETQQNRIARWNKFWEKHRSEVVSRLNQEAPRYDFSNDAFSGFTEIINKTYTPQSFDFFEPLRTVLLHNAFSTNTGCCSVVDVIHPNHDNLSEVESALNSCMAGKGYAFDFAGMNSAIAESLSDDFNYIGLACGLIVFLFLWLSFGRLELSLLAFLPMAMGWLWILGIMYLFGMRFNIVNIILATFIFGQGDDYTIFITDGLINEFAYRKKLLTSFKNSIIISALIMFIGIGSLIVAKHPALHSLAEVTIVGMFTVVLMAWIVPPLIFGWLTKKGDVVRKVPVTIEQLFRTACYSICRLFNRRTSIHHIFGVKTIIHNPHGEDFSKGSVIVCDARSSLATNCLLALSPRVLIKSDRDWSAKVCKEGYSLVSLTNGRNDEERDACFQNAFLLAQEIGADILPVFIHGTDEVMPRGNKLIACGRIDIEIGQRIPTGERQDDENCCQTAADNLIYDYRKHSERLKHQIEDTHYFHDFIIYKYIYKGIGIERETRRLLRQYDDFSQWIDTFQPSEIAVDAVSVIHAGNGQFSLLFALVHPATEVHSYTFDEDAALLALACDPLPSNLHIHYVKDENTALQEVGDSQVFNLSTLLA